MTTKTKPHQPGILYHLWNGLILSAVAFTGVLEATALDKGDLHNAAITGIIVAANVFFVNLAKQLKQ